MSTFLANTVFANFEDRTITLIVFEGLDRVQEQRIENLIQSTVGEIYDAEIVQSDVHTLNHLGEFKYISADVVLQGDGTIELIYTFREQQIITQVSMAGNTLISDNELLAVTPIMLGLGRDQDAIDRGKRAIMKMYQEQGNYQVEVFPEITVYGKDVDEFTGLRIDESVVLVYKIMEGNRVRVKGLSFFGNNSFTAKELSSEIDTRVSVPFFRRGELNEQVLKADVASLNRFYIDRGFRDISISYINPLSPSDKEAAVVFLIEEGPQYTIGGISTQFITMGDLAPVFTAEQIEGLIHIHVGDVFRQSDINKAVTSLNEAYGVLGRIIDVEAKQQAIKKARQAMFGGRSVLELDTTNAIPYHAEPGATVDIHFVIKEGMPTRVGTIEIQGNLVTKDKVIRGRLGLKPGYPFDVAKANRSKDRLEQTGLFMPNGVTMTIQPKDELRPYVRDLLVEVDETQTGSLSFGVMAGSDTGMLGDISLNERNFDIADWPESWEEFWQRKAFKGAGQQFSMAFQPGDELFNYSMGLTDPRFLDTDYSLGGTVGWSQRDYTDYTQETLYSNVSVGRRFGDIWYGSLNLTSNRVKLTEFDDNVPLEIFNDQGPSNINSLGLSLNRTTLAFDRPTEGSRISLNLNQYGLPSGDYTFTKAFISTTSYFAVDRDFLGNTTTLRLDTRLGYIFGGTSPTFEKFYLGGRSFRGFRFRSVSPLGTPRVAGGDPFVPIGGDWEIFLGAQYEFPVVDEFISMVAFVDSGTVTDSPGFDEYRVSVGTGLRLHIPQLGSAPLAFDFAFPIVKQAEDKKKTFSFSVQLPF
ncbi:MAG: BamA/TamA family outer membrane protein [Phycisphaerae bacterium]|nr:BamA/TamA family outer membrane protein [Phycisphaerae bacterium]